ncbi:RsmD family RNA methyltransferase [Leucobacter sp. CSA2]|uniref:RsmD family RNA methyltransferase n=1 Tax=Leucobacter edaphi TaxID=2796472 RepID=A0A934QAE3_9MICO|nr:RsmD family RNA methyltransferase [Leucobacter edaphi]
MTRIIAGIAGSLRLSVPKSGTRPTSDRVREAIFSSLESWDLIDGARVLDLYAGSGALGLEAASRGARRVELVEKHPAAAKIAQDNARIVLAAFTRGASGAQAPAISALKHSVQSYLDEQAARPAPPEWDVALLDPPYDLADDELTANLAALAPLIAPDGVVLVERSTRSGEPRWPAALVPLRDKRYGETALWWAERADRAADQD